jgi:hypothetical protein
VNMKCASGTSPWLNGNYQNKPSIILLPTGIIQISTTWVLPNGTHLIGVATSDPDLSGGATAPTTIQASTSFTTKTPMVQFGDSPPNCPAVTLGGCTAISVEHLTLDGNNNALIGIQNYYAQEHSYVDHVTLYHLWDVGLDIGSTSGGTATNSGPYSNIHYETGSNAPSTAVCAQIEGLSGTKGIHGMTCNSTPNAQSAILLDSSNNTIEDVRITGFYDGVLVGAKATAQSNVLRNIVGDITPSGSKPPPANAVHISSAQKVTDLAILGAANVLTASSGQYTIYDEATGAQLQSTDAADSSVAMYVLGQGKNNGRVRFSTSPSVPTWAVGSSAPTGACQPGSIFSCTGSTSQCTASGSAYTLWGCPGNTWQGIK